MTRRSCDIYSETNVEQIYSRVRCKHRVNVNIWELKKLQRCKYTGGVGNLPPALVTGLHRPDSVAGQRV